ncbi:MAG TPA: ABC transporter permease [Solirubrobacteraceae bacterium]|nr:ABC transporter permease [Solirubrobacteraceae bacterium]
MNWSETVRTSLSAVGTHRLRSALTMLGILIGVAAVILTVGLGEGAQDKVKSQINALGTNLLVVSPGSSTTSGGIRSGRGSSTTLTVADADTLASAVVAPDIANVAPVVSTSESLTFSTTNWTTQVVGTNPQWLSVRARSLAEGRFLTAADVSAGTAVVVLGPDTASQLFGALDPLGRSITVNGVTLQVIGVLTSSGSSDSTSTTDDQAIVPITTAQQRIIGGTTRNQVSSIYVEAKSSSALSAAYQEINGALLVRHNITAAASADFTITSQQSLVTTATSVDKTLTVLLAGIAGVSLLVGGIGVMNIMLVSVTERIREIGLRKALGATPRAIRRQFLSEASILGFSGGVLGVGLAVLGKYTLGHLINNPISLSPTASVAAFGVAVAIGVIFGVYPATRAARLAPIDALRSE